jgi:two pore calcium channel protein
MSGAEAPLITEDAPERGAPSSGTSVAGVGAQSSKKYRRRSDALAYGDRYQKAAALVDLVGSHSPLSASLSLSCSRFLPLL